MKEKGYKTMSHEYESEEVEKWLSMGTLQMDL
jgi:hypothetical protein